MFEIEINKFVKKVSLEQLAQMVISCNLKQVFFLERKKKKILIAFSQSSMGRIFNDKEYVLKTIITDILYVKVPSYKKIIIYNPFRGTCYTNDNEGLIKYEGTYVLPVMNFPSKLLNEIANAIFKEENKKTKERIKK